MSFEDKIIEDLGKSRNLSLIEVAKYTAKFVKEKMPVIFIVTILLMVGANYLTIYMNNTTDGVSMLASELPDIKSNLIVIVIGLLSSGLLVKFFSSARGEEKVGQFAKNTLLVILKQFILGVIILLPFYLLLLATMIFKPLTLLILIIAPFILFIINASIGSAIAYAPKRPIFESFDQGYSVIKENFKRYFVIAINLFLIEFLISFTLERLVSFSMINLTDDAIWFKVIYVVVLLVEKVFSTFVSLMLGTIYMYFAREGYSVYKSVQSNEYETNNVDKSDTLYAGQINDNKDDEAKVFNNIGKDEEETDD